MQLLLDPGQLNVSQGTRFYQVLAPYFDKVSMCIHVEQGSAKAQLGLNTR